MAPNSSAPPFNPGGARHPQMRCYREGLGASDQLSLLGGADGDGEGGSSEVRAGDEDEEGDSLGVRAALKARARVWIRSLVRQHTMYLYLVDEYTGRPVVSNPAVQQGCVYPVEITTPSEKLRKLLPLMHLGIAAMSLVNGGAGLAACFCYPPPKIPKSLVKGAKASAAYLGNANSAAQFETLQQLISGADCPSPEGSLSPTSVRGAILRDFEALIDAHDPDKRYGGLEPVLTWDGSMT